MPASDTGVLDLRRDGDSDRLRGTFTASPLARDLLKEMRDGR